MATQSTLPGATLPPGSTYQGPLPGFDATKSTILLAEDDEDLRNVTAYFLETLKFRVVACNSAEMASAAFRSESSIDILITDFQMPGRSGMELARELTTLQPSLPVLIVSGSVLSEKLLDEIRVSGWSFRSKPCRLDSLVDIIYSLLGQRLVLAA